MPLLADHLYTSKILPTIGGGGIGLLTTVDNLPAIQRRQYPTSYKPKSAAIKRSALLVETPLDLTVKANAGQQLGFASITPPSTPSPPPKKRYKFAPAHLDDYDTTTQTTVPPSVQIKDENSASSVHHHHGEQIVVVKSEKQRGGKKRGDGPHEKNVLANKNAEAEADVKPIIKQETPHKPILDTDLKMGKSVRPGKKQKRNSKATRKLKFDEDTSSPVSGTIIRRLEEIEDEDQIGDIDPEYNIVEVTEEAKAEIAAIVNVIGDYVCKLCKKPFEDAFELARHRCSCIVLLEYRCPECGKRFNCPANLASHRRWHKPRPLGRGGATSSSAKATATTTADKYSCTDCKKSFKRLAYLKKHQLTHENTNQVVQPERQIEDTHNSHSNGSFYSTGQELMKVDSNEEDESVAMETTKTTTAFQPNKLQAFTQIVFRYASSMTGHSSDDDNNIVYSPTSRGSTPVSMCSMPSPRGHYHGSRLMTEDENLAAAALAAMGHNGSSVIRHTTLSV